MAVYSDIGYRVAIKKEYRNKFLYAALESFLEDYKYVDMKDSHVKTEIIAKFFNRIEVKQFKDIPDLIFIIMKDSWVRNWNDQARAEAKFWDNLEEVEGVQEWTYCIIDEDGSDEYYCSDELFYLTPLAPVHEIDWESGNKYGI